MKEGSSSEMLVVLYRITQRYKEDNSNLYKYSSHPSENTLDLLMLLKKILVIYSKIHYYSHKVTLWPKCSAFNAESSGRQINHYALNDQVT